MFIFAVVSNKHKLRKYNITTEDLAEIYGLKNANTLRNSSAFNRYIDATIKIIEKVEQSIITKITE